MNNADLFQSLIDIVDSVVGVDSSHDGTIGLFHLLACAMDWCDARAIDLDAVTEEVREHFRDTRD